MALPCCKMMSLDLPYHKLKEILEFLHGVRWRRIYYVITRRLKLAGWLFPIPSGRCKVSGNSLDSSSVVIFHTVSRMKPGGMLQSFPQVWKRLNFRLENLDWRVREALDGVVRNTTYCMKGHTFNPKVFGRLEHQRGAKVFFAKRRSRIRPSILRPAPPEWIRCS